MGNMQVSGTRTFKAPKNQIKYINKTKRDKMDAEEIWNQYSPFDQPRTHQKQSLAQAYKALFVKDKDVVLLDLPTGVGKSGINTALCTAAKNAFMTTPQKSLREQLKTDSLLNQYYKVLKSRKDYSCGVNNGKTDCSNCPCYINDDQSCLQEQNCTYWQAKKQAMNAPTAVLTLAMLRYDSLLPPHTENGKQISFRKRDLLVVDEAHNLEGDVASMFAGFKISPYILPKETAKKLKPLIEKKKRSTSSSNTINKDEDIKKIIDKCEKNLDRRAKEIKNAAGTADKEEESLLETIENTLQKIIYLKKELNEGRPWVWDINGKASFRGVEMPVLKAKPVKVDRFLNQFIWNRANKIVLSTATLPYRKNPEKWLERLGLEDKSFEKISKPSPFPRENRKVYTKTSVGSMGAGSWKNEHSEKALNRIRRIIDKHKGQKGVIHVSSYEQAQFISEKINKVEKHDNTQEYKNIVELWNGNPVIATPNMKEGVDLKEDKCRFQILFKTPWPHLGDSRVSYIKKELGDERWYCENAAIDVVQSVGRGVRSKDDGCEYYVLDSSFLGLKQYFPDWFKEGVV